MSQKGSNSKNWRQSPREKHQVSSIRHSFTIQRIGEIKNDLDIVKQDIEEIKEAFYNHKANIREEFKQLREDIWQASNRQLRVVIEQQDTPHSPSRK